MPEKIETKHYNSNFGSDMDLINTGSTFDTIIGEDYDNKKGFMESKVNTNRSSAIMNDSENSITDEALLSQIKDRQSEEKKILRTLDRHMMPLFCVFYFVDFLDRANIGNATYVQHINCQTLHSSFNTYFILCDLNNTVLVVSQSTCKYVKNHRIIGRI